MKGIVAIVNNNGRTEDIYTRNHIASKPMGCIAIKDSSGRIDIIPSSRSCQCKIKEEKSNVSVMTVFSLCALITRVTVSSLNLIGKSNKHLGLKKYTMLESFIVRRMTVVI